MSLVMDGTTPRSRSTDPVTSVVAGRSVDLLHSQQLVLEVFEISPVHGFAQFEVERVLFGQLTPSRIRSAVSELTEKGLLYVVEGEYRTTPSGRNARVYKLNQPVSPFLW